MKSHTPGPWRYAAAQNYDGFAIFPDLLYPSIAAVHNFPNETEANARLIAAAPMLLEALEALYKTAYDLTGNDLGRAIMDKAQQALAAAKGTK